MAERGHPVPSARDVEALLAADFARAGWEIDTVTVSETARPPKVLVVADGDRPLTLDTVAELSRVASALLDPVPGMPEDYLLEVSSPGVERPMTTEKHFRRAHGRRAEVVLTDGSTVTGRLGPVADGTVALVVGRRGALSVRPVPLTDIVRGVVQVEFTPPAAAELQLAGVSGDEEA